MVNYNSNFRVRVYEMGACACILPTKPYWNPLYFRENINFKNNDIKKWQSSETLKVLSSDMVTNVDE